ncbi:hypothetical protein OW763_08555 [Clostridium aestuarii]|uniref:DUF3953 domain-containing protein n=1 Tax=Clostridium aestuarii TaxID=338193 RepID=A0ABT4CZZ1_9CLOT|nr:hypothetical protein [Clostridium aestuarii]MCY6484407.1 hypothetical protein [Clostridium aestuarii]
MKKIISIFAWISVLITTLCLILTMFSTYQFINLEHFNSYYIFQCSIIITMLLWSVKQLCITNKEWVNSLLCMFVGFGTMFFMFMEIY